MGNTTHTPESFCTSVLRTSDPERAASFYGSLMGWTSVKVSEAPAHCLLRFNGKTVAKTCAETAFEPFRSYVFFKRGDTQEGGILPIGPNWEVPPRWNSIFAVNECDGTLKRGEELGGSAEFMHTVPRAGRIGIIRDPGGAVFVIRGPVPS